MEDDENKFFTVTFKPGVSLGMRLMPLAAGSGACFDGWTDMNRAEGEYHELLEPGDRLVMVEEHTVGFENDLESIISLIKRCSDEVREQVEAERKRKEEKEKEEKEQGVIFDSRRKSKYNIDNGAATSRRLLLKFAKPSSPMNIEIQEEDTEGGALRIWLQPASRLMFGARFLRCAKDAKEVIHSKFQRIDKGALLVGINGRAIEGLRFDQVIGTISHASFPLAIRISMDSAAHAVIEDEDAKVIPGFDLESLSSEGEEEEEDHKEREGKSLERVVAPRPSRFELLEERDDGCMKVNKIPFAKRHLEKFIMSIRENDRRYFLGRLKLGQNLCVKDGEGDTVLMVAATGKEENAEFFVARLLEQGVPVNDQNELNGKTAMHKAAGAGNTIVLALLKAAGGNVNMTDWDGRTPLIDAVQCERFRAVEFLLDSRAKVSQRELSSGWSAIHFAAQSGREDIVQILVEKGRADVHELTKPAPYRERRTPIDIAREAGNKLAAAFIHETLASEPLQLIWPKGSEWVVENTGVSSVDLMWRQGALFEPYVEIEWRERNIESNFLRIHRDSRPNGRHSSKFLSSREQRLFPEDDIEREGQIWIGSRESLSHKWIVEKKGIERVMILVKNKREAEDVKSSNMWIGKLPHVFISPLPESFRDFMATSMPLAVKFAYDCLESKERLLITSWDCGSSEPLWYPAAVAMISLISKYELRYTSLKFEFEQRCYFYTVKGALEKEDRLSKIDGTYTEKDYEAEMVEHDISHSQKRVLIPQEWCEGLLALDGKVQDRKLERTRQRQAKFRATFIM